jgi:Fe-S oxidoreductase
VELVEFDENRVNSMCCGMGGGRIWVDTLMADRFVNIRLEQAVASGAKELVTTCPYCVTNFEDARVNMNFDNVIEIKDLTEVLQELI